MVEKDQGSSLMRSTMSISPLVHQPPAAGAASTPRR
jgi:hypothetical protein